MNNYFIELTPSADGQSLDVEQSVEITIAAKEMGWSVNPMGTNWESYNGL